MKNYFNLSSRINNVLTNQYINSCNFQLLLDAGQYPNIGAFMLQAGNIGLDLDNEEFESIRKEFFIMVRRERTVVYDNMIIRHLSQSNRDKWIKYNKTRR